MFKLNQIASNFAKQLIHKNGSNSVVVVKLLACGQENTQLEHASHQYDFRRRVSPASKLRYDINNVKAI